MSYLYSKLPETGVSPHIGTGGLIASAQKQHRKFWVFALTWQRMTL